MDLILIFVILFFFLFASMPIAISLGLSTLITMVLTTDYSVSMIAQNAFSGLNSFPLLAIPLFILAGSLMQYGGISKRILDFADALVGFIAGGLAMVTTVSCMFFAAISGSAPATVSAIGSFMIPAMDEKGYDRGFAGALVAAAGSIGVIIPPSIPFVIYAVATGVSVTDMFIAGVIPGLLMGVGLMTTSYLIAKKNGWKGTDNTPFKKDSHYNKDLGKSIVKGFWALLTPIVILGGIYASIVTPTEAAVIGVVYSFLVGMFIYKELTWATVYNAMVDTVLISGATTFMLGLSSSFAKFLTMQQVPVRLAEFTLGISTNFIVIILVINLLLLIVGCFMDNISATVILAPIFLPIITGLGMDPVQFGVIMTMNLAIGYITPPYGTNLFVASAIGGMSVETIIRRVVPMIITLIIVLMMTTFIPWLTMGFL